MPKRKGKKSKKSESESSSRASEMSSVYSDLSSRSDATLSEYSTPQERIKILLERMGEKRSSTRIQSLKSFIKLLQTKFLPHELEDIMFTVRDRLVNCIKSKDNKESTLAAEAIGLVSLNQCEINSPELLKTLKTIMGDHSKHSNLRASAARTLAMLVFVEGIGRQDTIDCMQELQEYFNSKDVVVLQGVVSAWTLLASSLTRETLVLSILASVGHLLTKLLDTKNVQVKEVAGRAVALLIAAYTEVESTSDLKMDHKSEATIEEFLDNATEKLQNLASASSKSQSKKDRAKQRGNFRVFLRTVEEEEEPSETLHINENEISIDGWNKTLQLWEMRRWLSLGLQKHLQENTMLADIFDFELRYLTKDEIKEAREDKIYHAKINARARKKEIRDGWSKKTSALVSFDDE